MASFGRLRWDLLQAVEGSAESLPTECESERQVGGVGWRVSEDRTEGGGLRQEGVGAAS